MESVVEMRQDIDDLKAKVSVLEFTVKILCKRRKRKDTPPPHSQEVKRAVIDYKGAGLTYGEISDRVAIPDHKNHGKMRQISPHHVAEIIKEQRNAILSGEAMA